jgi:hypothetical protein
VANVYPQRWPTQFGATAVEGLKDIEEAVVLSELTYKPGEPFPAQRWGLRKESSGSIYSAKSSSNRSPPANTVVPVKIRLEEKPPREIRWDSAMAPRNGYAGNPLAQQ